MSQKPRATIVITTRNREEDLYKSLIFLQSSIDMNSVDALIVDDASDDVSESYWDAYSLGLPITMIRNPRRSGYIIHRNIGYASADSDYVFSFDDDSVPVDNDGLRNAIAYLDRHPRVGALSFPLVDGFGPFAPDKRKAYRCRSFVGCAHAVRRDLFVRLGGFRTDFVHQGEETEFCYRLWRAGFEVHAFPGCRVFHWATSAARSSARMGYFGPRNRMFAELLHAPRSALPLQVLRIVGSYAKLSLKTRMPHVHGWGLLAGLAKGALAMAERRPLSRRLYDFLQGLPPDGGNSISPPPSARVAFKGQSGPIE